MANSITVRWPGGVYLGHQPDGSAELFPSFARLFSALVHAGFTGASLDALTRSSPQEPSASPEYVLTWLENNPPIGLRLPTLISGRRFEAMAYRKEGVFKKEGKATNYKVTGRAVGEGTAVGGPISWVWESDFPNEIVTTLDLMCADVGCLGEASSMVIIELEQGVEATHHYSQGRQFFTSGGLESEIVNPGRLRSLQSQYSEANPSKLPSLAQDRHNTSAMPSSEIPTNYGLEVRRLASIKSDPEPPVPWDSVVAIPIEDGREVKPEDRVAFAVATHRALIARIGTGAPAAITGKYDEGVLPPANRVAIQYLPSELTPYTELEQQDHLLLLLPFGLPESELNVLADSLVGFRTIRSRIGKFTLSPDIQFLSGASFWSQNTVDDEPTWTIFPAAIPERWATGRNRSDVYLETIAWSLGNVLRSLPQLDPSKNANERTSQLTSMGLTVENAGPLVTRHPARFAHRTNKSMPILPFKADLRLGALLPKSAILAIGQSRHMSGGLLVPSRETPERDDLIDHS